MVKVKSIRTGGKGRETETTTTIIKEQQCESERGQMSGKIKHSIRRNLL